MNNNIDIYTLVEKIRMVRETGKLIFGFEKVEKTLISNEKPKLVILSKKAPREIYNRIKYLAESKNVPIFELDVTTNDLGTFCGRPHRVSCFCIMDAGQSDILEYLEVNKWKLQLRMSNSNICNYLKNY